MGFNFVREYEETTVVHITETGFYRGALELLDKSQKHAAYKLLTARTKLSSRQLSKHAILETR